MKPTIDLANISQRGDNARYENEIPASDDSSANFGVNLWIVCMRKVPIKIPSEIQKVAVIATCHACSAFL